MKKVLHVFALFVSVLFLFVIVPFGDAKAQIYEPEGLNMPGAWNSWTNPPDNNLALANPNQVTNGRLVKIAAGQTRWQTILSVAASGADLVGGTYEWLFTSGPLGNPYQNKWAGVTVMTNAMQTYVKESSTNNSVTLVNGQWYTVNWEDLGYQNCRAIFMETSGAPVNISSVSLPATVNENVPVTITATLNAAPSFQELIYLRYTTDNWATSAAVGMTVNGTSCTAQIPGQAAGTAVSYYVFTSTIGSLTSDYDLCTIHLNNNGGANYGYTVGTPHITWANLQFPASGAITTGDAFNVYGQAYIAGLTGNATAAAGLQAWVGYSTSDTDPSGWSNWIPAAFNGPAGSNDEFVADLGTVLASAGTWYYATRFQYNTDAYVYGGYSDTGGGYWDGTTNTSGVLTVTDPVPDPDFDWVNLQFPGSATIEPGQNLDIFAQAYINGLTGPAGPAAGVTAWIGYSTANSNPSTWTHWFVSSYNGASGNNDEFVTNLGQFITSEGTYYYASRFQRDNGSYFYGGFSETGGGFWDGTSNVSGVLTVQSAPPVVINWANVQFPGSGSISAGDNFDVYAQAYIEGITGTGSASSGLEAWIGVSDVNGNPAAFTQWFPASFSAASGNNDEFVAEVGSALAEGAWYYASRFRYNNGAFVYGGFSDAGGGFWDGVSNVSGVLTVTAPAQTFPVLFTIIDATQIHDNIKFKGEMTNWDTIAMQPDNHVWTLTLDMLPGTYQWGAIQDDGSQFGIWLIEGGNLVMTLNGDGSTSGTVTYTTLVTKTQTETLAGNIYPNPVQRMLYIEQSGESGYQLYNAQGMMIASQDGLSGSFAIDVNDFVPGIYFLRLARGGNAEIRKICKY